MGEAVRFVGSLESQSDLKQDELLTVINLYHFKGDIERELGQPQPGLESYRRALHFDEQLSARFPGGRAQHSMSLDLSMVGDALAELGDLKGALDEYDKALKLRLENVQQNPDNAMYRRELALLYDWMGHYTGAPFRLNVGDREKAEKYYRQFVAIAEDLGRADPKNAQGQMDILFSYEHLANVLIATDPAQAAELYRKALAVLHPLVDKSPDELRYVRRQITQQRLLATSWQKLGDHRNALNTMRASLGKVRALMAKRPGNVALQGDLYDALMASSNLLLETGAREEASNQLRQAVALAEELAKARPSDLYWQWRLADACSALGRYHGSLGSDSRRAAQARLASLGEARAWQQKALDVWDNWSRQAVSSVFNTTRRQDAVRALAQSDAALASLKAKRR
jgi:tetratricopeptide (TPR) repeat protein